MPIVLISRKLGLVLDHTRFLCAKVAKLAIFLGKCISHKNGTVGKNPGDECNLWNFVSKLKNVSGIACEIVECIAV